MPKSRNDLDRRLDRLDAGENAEPSGDLAPLLRPARAARTALGGSLPAEVERRHLDALHDDRRRNIVVAPPIRRRGLRVVAASLVAGVVLTACAGSAVAASSSALPGDALYGLKRFVERASLAMHRDPIGRGALQLHFAQVRLDEVRALIAAGEAPDEAIAGLQGAIEAAEREAEDAVALGRDADALLAHVQQMIAKHIAVLQGVLAKVPDSAKDAIQRAIENAQKAAEKVQHGKSGNNGNPSPGGKPTDPPGNSGEAPGQGGGGNSGGNSDGGNGGGGNGGADKDKSSNN